MRTFLAVLAALVTLSATGFGHNTLQSNDGQIKSSWADVLNQYQRRADLTPTLANTVNGFAVENAKDISNSTAVNFAPDPSTPQGAAKRDTK